MTKSDEYVLDSWQRVFESIDSLFWNLNENGPHEVAHEIDLGMYDVSKDDYATLHRAREIAARVAARNAVGTRVDAPSA